MSDALLQFRSGDFATARRGGLDASEVAFIQARAQRVPASQLAKMLGRPVQDVARYIAPAPVSNDVRPLQVVGVQPPAASPPTAGSTRVRIERDAAGRAHRRTKPEPTAMPSWVREIAARVGERHGLELEALVGRDRSAKYSAARHEAYHALYATGRCSFFQIGCWFGGRDHGTIFAGIARHKAVSRWVDATDLDAWRRLGERGAAK